ncbi:MAG: peptidyl-prolyl cis-trans isomerase, partial [Gammaproteobacteria bacterium]|nr:peptidyl-prolyl cis-trans isomerase [Gammaproteobacteria bacterium]
GSSIFSLNEGDLDGPLKGDFGFHIVRLDEVLEPGPLPLDQVRGELLAEFREREADDRFRDLERSVSDALFDSTTIEDIAAAVGLEVQSATGFTRNGGEPLGANQAAIDAIFEDGVLRDGRVSDIVELDANRSAVFSVAQFNEATRQPLDEVRDQIVALLTSQEADLLMVARAEQMLEAIAGGADFGQAAEAVGLSVAPPQIIGRNSQEVDQALLFDAFAAGKPTADEPIHRRVRALNGGYVVYSLDAVLPGRPEAIPVAERDQGKLMLAQQSGLGDFQAFVAALEDNADIVINNDLLAADDLFQ